MAIVDAEALAERVRNLGALNGIRLVLVSVPAGGVPDRATLEVRFHNASGLAGIVAAIAGGGALARDVFPITGGRRRPAGPATGQVQVTAVAATGDPRILSLTVAPIGDYSTYVLEAHHASFDPLPALSAIPFKFRPGCFSTECAPCASPGVPAPDNPAIDYLAKDYESFRHTLIAAMMRKVPGWTPTSEADLDQTLLELFSVAGDELSDFQDRVMNEAYLGTARKRVSLARHARLVDYHVHQGNQAGTWLALEVTPGLDGRLPAGFTAWAGPPDREGAQVFITREREDAPGLDRRWRVHHLLNRLELYTWSGAQPALRAGDTSADLALADPTQAAADAVTALICSGEITRLVIEEARNPATGGEAGRDKRKRELLRLRPCEAGDPKPGAESVRDPLTGRWLVRVRWEEKLQFNYCGTIDCPPPVGRVTGVTLFYGNLALAYHGEPRTVRFADPSVPLAGAGQLHYEPSPAAAVTDDGDPCCDAHSSSSLPARGVVCRLPEEDRLLYRKTDTGGEVPPLSTLAIFTAEGEWEERISFVRSRAGPDDRHFVVETDEEGRSAVRFGHDGNGRELPPGAVVQCSYQVGDPLAGNVGADAIAHLDGTGVAFGTLAPLAEVIAFRSLLAQARVHNPFDVGDGRAPETAASVLRHAPEAYRARQLRAVTLEDYVRRAEEVPGVSRAAAAYAWTGSWRTVRIAIDPEGATELAPALRARVAAYLDSVRLIGEDLEIRPPRYVPLDVRLAVCARPEFWPEDVAFVLREEFSDSFTSDGRPGFFNPDRFTFGQPLHASEIIGRAQSVTGVEHVISLTMKRWNAPVIPSDAIVDVRANEIILVHNDPDDMERGFITIDVRGGRR